MSEPKVPVAIIGSGNIGTDLMIKVLRTAQHLSMAALVGIDRSSDGLQRAARLGVATTAEGIDGLLRLPNFASVRLAFDATSASAHARHAAVLRRHGVQVIDLTPAAIGPYVVPVVNLDAHLAAPNINMVTCGGQATIPIVRAVSRVATVHYAEIVASIASKSAGPGTRANIDEFTATTARALESVGGAARGKAIIVLNPAEPPLIMRDTVFCLASIEADEEEIRASIAQMVAEVARYVPGFRLKQDVQFDRYDDGNRLSVPGLGKIAGLKVSVFLEVEGAAHYLPAYAGNLDIMTSAALAAAERIAQRRHPALAACGPL
jgi:acetaldehyde dehydrogenase